RVDASPRRDARSGSRGKRVAELAAEIAELVEVGAAQTDDRLRAIANFELLGERIDHAMLELGLVSTRRGHDAHLRDRAIVVGVAAELDDEPAYAGDARELCADRVELFRIDMTDRKRDRSRARQDIERPPCGQRRDLLAQPGLEPLTDVER